MITGPAVVLEQSPPGKACRFSIIIPAWNRAELLRKTLPAVIRETRNSPGVEIILADNRSIDSTLDVVAEFPEVVYLPISAPGAGQARNGAAHGAAGEVLVFLDCDCLPQPGWLDFLTRPLREEGVAIACGAALAVCAKRGCSVPAEDLIPRPGREDVFENNFAVHAELFRRAGGFNVKLGPVGGRWRTHEGRDLLQRIRKVQPGARWAGIPGAVVQHFIQTQGGHPGLGGRRAWWGGVQMGQQSAVPNLLKPAAQGIWNTCAALPFLLGALLRRSPSNLERFRNKVHRIGECYGSLRASVHRTASHRRGTVAESMAELCAGEGRPKSLQAYRVVWPEVRVSMKAAELQAPFQHPFFSQTAAYRIPPREVAIFESARVMANPVGVITREGCLLGEVSLDWGRITADHAWFRKKQRDPILSLPGTSALLATTGGDSFYHWLLECLPRLALCEGLCPDRWIVNDSTKPFVRESLALAGIGPEKIFSLAGTGLVECERLFVPALPGPTGFPHPMAVAWLRSFFKPFTANNQGEKLCIERPAPGRRRWVPSPNLKEQLGRAGFQLISPEHLSLKDQVALISAAPEILAPHGAALAWLALAPPGCRVIELVPAGYPNPCFYRLSRICKLPHVILFSGKIGTTSVWDLNPSDSTFPEDDLMGKYLATNMTKET